MALSTISASFTQCVSGFYSNNRFVRTLVLTFSPYARVHWGKTICFPEQSSLWPTFQNSASSQPLSHHGPAFSSLTVPLSQHASISANTAASGGTSTSGRDSRDRRQQEDSADISVSTCW